MWQHEDMKERELLVSKSNDGYIVGGRCSGCHRPFDSAIHEPMAASNEVVRQFESHACNEDANQAAARVVRASTEKR
jgi:hypothetical protein